MIPDMLNIVHSIGVSVSLIFWAFYYHMVQCDQMIFCNGQCLLLNSKMQIASKADVAVEL